LKERKKKAGLEGKTEIKKGEKGEKGEKERDLKEKNLLGLVPEKEEPELETFARRKLLPFSLVPNWSPYLVYEKRGIGGEIWGKEEKEKRKRKRKKGDIWKSWFHIIGNWSHKWIGFSAKKKKEKKRKEQRNWNKSERKHKPETEAKDKEKWN